MNRPLSVTTMALALLCQACTSTGTVNDLTELHRQVVATEKAFARSMQDRDFDAFRSFLADDAIFVANPEPFRGKEAVALAWGRYFEDAEAPFSWGPEKVVVSDSGELALSSGPVYNPDGAEIGTFTSIWQRESAGDWRIIFDKGGCSCE